MQNSPLAWTAAIAQTDATHKDAHKREVFTKHRSVQSLHNFLNAVNVKQIWELEAQMARVWNL